MNSLAGTASVTGGRVDRGAVGGGPPRTVGAGGVVMLRLRVPGKPDDRRQGDHEPDRGQPLAARLDPVAGTMQYVCAGHPAPLLIHSGAAGKDLGVLGGKGFMLGIDEDLPFVEQVCPFEPGDRLVFYTDGLVEVEREDRQYLGEEGLLDICAQLPADGEQAADWVIEQAVAFNEPAVFSDDVTLVVLDRPSAE